MTSPTGRFARVYIQLKARSLERPFDYVIPEAMDGQIRPGSAVLVPFGRSKVLGLVAGTGQSTEIPEERLSFIEAVLDYPPIPQKLIKLSLWVSRYYYCSPAAALGLVLPPGGLPALVKEAAGKTPVYTLKPPRVKARSAQFVRAARTCQAEYRRTPARQRVLDVLKGRDSESEVPEDTGAIPVTQLLKLAQVGRSTLKSMAGIGLVEIFEEGILRDGLRYYGNGEEKDAGGAEKPPLLNPEQERALRAIISRLGEDEAGRRSRPILIEGVAGAGKTEVYLRAIEEVVDSGGGAIVLVPEISLTHQAVRRFRRRFGDAVGILHSGLGLGERYDEYMRIRGGEARVVIGPRSALFAPVAGLRMIVIDEEHDSSFKQENEPRYDARRAAVERARLEGSAVVLGSATPSMESRHLVKDRYVLPERATGAPMPAVQIIDMRGQAGGQIFSARLLDELDRTLRTRGKSILMLNSRGFARFMQCAQCGHVWKCGNCEVSLTVHADRGRLLCHHCGHAEALPGLCPECSSTQLRRWGVGTERLEQEVRRLFPDARIFRLDADTARGYGAAPRILEEFSKAERAILVGTQMVAKGHHFPEVTLAAVINADLALEFPEFRAEEQTFSLLMQLAGRSGRAEKPGKVLIQTWNADIECIRMAANGAVDDFYREELKRRRRLDYPPFVRLINIICRSREEAKSHEAAAFLKKKLKPALASEKLLGPAPLFKLKGWSRSHMLVKTDRVEGTLAAIKPVIEKYREPYRRRGVRIVVDVDPQWLS